jgi:hypothetical protein
MSCLLETFTPCIFIPILGTCFFAFQLNLGAFCLQFVDVSLNFDPLKLNWVTKIGIFRISWFMSGLRRTYQFELARPQYPDMMHCMTDYKTGCIPVHTPVHSSDDCQGVIRTGHKICKITKWIFCQTWIYLHILFGVGNISKNRGKVLLFYFWCSLLYTGICKDSL